MGSKSMVAARLWGERYHRDAEWYHAIQRDNGITQILHEQGFDDHIPACHQI